jgi:5-hydroxyisourate hydrolase
MGLTTHVLDTMHGRPAAGMTVALYRTADTTGAAIAAPQLLGNWVLNADGRAASPLLEGASWQAGHYRLVFDVAAYFRAQGVTLPEPCFLNLVNLDFGVAAAGANPAAAQPATPPHYHVPLLVSPWSYSTYRGS